MNPVVSVIIPCYNADRWVAEAIQSCLDQTYSPVEVVVVDDGSTDRSLEVIKSFGNKIEWVTGPNRGGSAARNRGFAISKGEYIQFLDADDYILPEKIASQVAFLGKTGADVVYGDWRHQHHRQDGKVEFENVAASGEQTDVLGALLSDWWVASLALLFRRSIVQKIGGWDESLKAAQDTDFFISVALAGAAIRYLPGCNSVYRRYGAVTVSTGNRMRWLESRCCVFDKASAKLAASGRLNAKYRHGLAQSYFALARLCFDHDRSKYQEIMTKVLALEPGFRPPESRIYNAVQRVFGFSTAELLASWKRRLRHQ